MYVSWTVIKKGNKEKLWKNPYQETFEILMILWQKDLQLYDYTRDHIKNEIFSFLFLQRIYGWDNNFFSFLSFIFLHKIPKNRFPLLEIFYPLSVIQCSLSLFSFLPSLFFFFFFAFLFSFHWMILPISNHNTGDSAGCLVKVFPEI